MSKVDHYASILSSLEEWQPYLLENSGLPGPRGNIELARAFAAFGDEGRIERYLANAPEEAPTNSPREFLAFCGVLGLGQLAAQGQVERMAKLRLAATDPRWRVREAVAMALQTYGQTAPAALLAEMREWAQGELLERRAAAAGLCEPSFLTEDWIVEETLAILDEITDSLKGEADRKSEEFRVLRQGLGYCWSVAAVAEPERGKAKMEKWLADEDRDIRWIMKQNLKKKRLQKMDGAWVAAWEARLSA
jgi:hypothetical protein